VYYSSEVFLFGAELTRAYSVRHGSQRPDRAAPETANSVGS
jgi:membrane protein